MLIFTLVLLTLWWIAYAVTFISFCWNRSCARVFIYMVVYRGSVFRVKWKRVGRSMCVYAFDDAQVKHLLTLTHIIHVQIYVLYSQIQHILWLYSHTNIQLLGRFFRIKKYILALPTIELSTTRTHGVCKWLESTTMIKFCHNDSNKQILVW